MSTPAHARGLIDETESDLTRGRRLALIREGDLLETGGGVSDEHGVLVRGGVGGLGGGEDLLCPGRIGTDGVDTGNELNVRGNGPKAEIVGQRGGTLIDVEAGSVGRGSDDADLRHGRGDDRLTAGEGQGSDSREKQSEPGDGAVGLKWP